jgi:hypothetical protein
MPVNMAASLGAYQAISQPFCRDAAGRKTRRLSVYVVDRRFRRWHSMKTSRNGLRSLTLAVAALLAAGAGTTHSVVARAADGPMPCSAFARNSTGGWRVLAPVTLELGDRLYSPMVGTTFAAGATQNGIEMSDILDQQCGNR